VRALDGEIVADRVVLLVSAELCDPLWGRLTVSLSAPGMLQRFLLGDKAVL